MLDAAMSFLSGSAGTGPETGLMILKIITAILAAVSLIATVLKISAGRKKKATLQLQLLWQ